MATPEEALRQLLKAEEKYVRAWVSRNNATGTNRSKISEATGRLRYNLFDKISKSELPISTEGISQWFCDEILEGVSPDEIKLLEVSVYDCLNAWISHQIEGLANISDKNVIKNRVGRLVIVFRGFEEVRYCLPEASTIPFPPSQASKKYPSEELDTCILMPICCPMVCVDNETYTPMRRPFIDVSHCNPFLDSLSDPEKYWSKIFAGHRNRALECLSHIQDVLPDLTNAFLTRYHRERDAEIAIYPRLQNLFDSTPSVRPGYGRRPKLVIQTQWGLNLVKSNANGVVMIDRRDGEESSQEGAEVKQWNEFTVYYPVKYKEAGKAARVRFRTQATSSETRSEEIPDSSSRSDSKSPSSPFRPLSDDSQALSSACQPSSSDSQPSPPDSQPSSSDSQPSPPDSQPSSSDSQPSPPDSHTSSSSFRPLSDDSQALSSACQPSSSDSQPSPPDSQPPDSLRTPSSYSNRKGQIHSDCNELNILHPDSKDRADGNIEKEHQKQNIEADRDKDLNKSEEMKNSIKTKPTSLPILVLEAKSWDSHHDPAPQVAIEVVDFVRSVSPKWAANDVVLTLAFKGPVLVLGGVLFKTNNDGDMLGVAHICTTINFQEIGWHDQEAIWSPEWLRRSRPIAKKLLCFVECLRDAANARKQCNRWYNTNDQAERNSRKRILFDIRELEVAAKADVSLREFPIWEGRLFKFPARFYFENKFYGNSKGRISEYFERLDKNKQLYFAKAVLDKVDGVEQKDLKEIDVVVKIVPDRYGGLTHELLHKNKLAPKLFAVDVYTKTSGFFFVIMDRLPLYSDEKSDGYSNLDDVKFTLTQDGCEKLKEKLKQLKKLLKDENLVHGDLKPVNLMVNPRGDLKIVDFDCSTDSKGSIIKYPPSSIAAGLPIETDRENLKKIENMIGSLVEDLPKKRKRTSVEEEASSESGSIQRRRRLDVFGK